MWCYVKTNTTDADSIIKLRKNLSDGSGTLTIPANTTGEFEDTTNSDSLSVGDEVNYSITAGTGTGSLAMGPIRCHYATANSTTAPLQSCGAFNFTANSATRYLMMGGRNAINTSEASAQTLMKNSGTLANFFVYASTNARVTDTTFRVRKNGSNGNQVITVGAGVTGIFEDTSNSDSFVADDLVNCTVVTGTGSSESIVIQQVSTELTTTDNTFLLIAGQNGNYNTGSGSSSAYFPWSGGNNLSTEIQTSAEPGMSCTASVFVFKVNANTLDNTATVSVRVNGGNSTLSVSVGAGATGSFEDTDSVSLVATDQLNLLVDTSAATAGSIGWNPASLLLTLPSGVVASAYLTLLGVGS
jgi:hypothetical protein